MEQKREFFIKHKKVEKLTHFLIKYLPKLNINFAVRGGARSRTRPIDFGRYDLHEEEKKIGFFEFKLKKGIYECFLDFTKIEEQKYETIIKTLKKKYPEDFSFFENKQKERFCIESEEKIDSITNNLLSELFREFDINHCYKGTHKQFFANVDLSFDFHEREDKIGCYEYRRKEDVYECCLDLTGIESSKYETIMKILKKKFSEFFL